MKHQLSSLILDGLNINMGQVHRRHAMQNAGWYTIQGLYLGWGDLTAANLADIQRSLGDHDAFVMVDEETHWSIVKARQSGLMSPVCTCSLTGYLTDHAARFVTKSGFYRVINKVGFADTKETVDGLAFDVINWSEANYLLGQLTAEHS